jgi:hypothetical protein
MRRPSSANLSMRTAWKPRMLPDETAGRTYLYLPEDALYGPRSIRWCETCTTSCYCCRHRVARQSDLRRAGGGIRYSGRNPYDI